MVRRRVAAAALRGLVTAAAVFAGCATRPPPRTIQLPPPAEAPSTPPALSLPGSKALRAVSSMPPLIAEPRIRVGLLTDLPAVAFPRSASGYYVAPERGGVFLLGRGVTVGTPSTNAPPSFAVQVAALSDQRSAVALVERLRREAGVETESVFDAASGLHRVLAGRAADRNEAEAIRARLVGRGWDRGMFVVRRPSDARAARAMTVVDDEGDQHAFDADSILLVPAGGEGIEIDGRRYRGGARVFLNDRGLLNVINELGLEEYLRGVVPNEMGPKTYDRLEALEAQAIAARTYAVKRRGDFSREGYDLCATAACQVYGGMESEHPLSDRAVAESAGLILTFGGAPIDALYTSTCGGRTSDVSTMFPERREPYLRGVSCADLELARIEGRADGPVVTESEVRGALFRFAAGLEERSQAWSAREVDASVSAAAKLAGVALRTSRGAASSRRRDVLAVLGAALGLDEAAAALLLPEDIEYLHGAGSPATASFLTKYRMTPAQFGDSESLDRAIGRDELHAILYSWLLARKGIDELTGKVGSLDQRTVGLESDGKTTAVALPDGLPLFRQINDRAREVRNLELMIGDRARIVRDRSSRPVAAIFEANYDGAAFDRTSSWSSWVRSWRADELVPAVSRRFPVTRIEDLRPLESDAAHRVKRLQVVADAGRTFTLEGIVIRWSLNVPDNLFILSRSVDPDGTARFTFYGKGWGHGTGMCQVGAYGMAFRGATAREILEHYYTGAKVERMGDRVLGSSGPRGLGGGG